MTTTFSRRGVQMKVRRVDWNPLEHPRDREGQFIETGAEVLIVGSGMRGTVERNLGNSRLEVLRSDGRRVGVHRNSVMVIARPDGSEPTAREEDEPAPAPVEAPSPEVEDVEATDVAKPVYSDVVEGERPSTTEEENMAASVEQDRRVGYMVTDEDIAASTAFPASTDAEDAVAGAHKATTGGDADPDPERGHETIEQAGTVYRFKAAYEETAVKAIEAANRRAQRAGIESRFNYSIAYEDVENTDPQTGIKTYERYAVVTLDRPTVEHGGWTFAATLTWDEDAGLITRTAPNATLVHRPEARKCDVCKSARDRRDTYVVQKGDEEVQVGRNCLQQFMGIRPAGLWMLGWELEVDDSERDETGGGGSRGEMRVSSEQMLAITLAVVGEDGWVSRGAAQAYNAAGGSKTSTADKVMEVMWGRSTHPDSVRWREDMLAKSRDLTAEAAALLEFARTIDGDNDYALNLRAAATPDTVSARNVPLLASAVAASNARKERDARDRAREETKQTSDHVGQEGEKIDGVNARVLGVRVSEGAYGPTTLFTFQDENGNVLKWWASGNKSEDAAIDDTVTLKGTIKKHDEFRGVKETVLTRVKITPTGDAKAKADERAKAKAEAEARREAEAAAERAEVEKMLAARRDPAPEGYTPYDGEAPLPPGTVVRAKRGSQDRYANAYVVAGPYDLGGEQKVLLVFHEDMGAWPVRQPATSVGSIAPQEEQDITTGQEVAAKAMANVDVQPGQTPVEYRDRDTVVERLSPGQTIRVYFRGKYENVTVAAIAADGAITVVTNDGERHEIAGKQVSALG